MKLMGIGDEAADRIEGQFKPPGNWLAVHRTARRGGGGLCQGQLPRICPTRRSSSRWNNSKQPPAGVLTASARRS